MGRIITLTTDFGNRDWFVGSMKGVIKSIAPKAEVVDVTHEIDPGDTRAASFVLAAAMPCFPKGTIHVAVVDPGVGSARRAIAVRGRRSVMVGPDNGVLTMPMEAEAPCKAVQLTARKYFLRDVSSTFHGRDVFAPVAAYLSLGVQLQRMGKTVSRVNRFHIRQPAVKAGIGRGTLRCPPWRSGYRLPSWRGEIVYIDHFGNAITNLPASGRMSPRVSLGVGGVEVRGLSPAYGSGSGKRLIAVVNSLGLIELAVRGGSAADRFRLKVGQTVELKVRRPSIDP